MLRFCYVLRFCHERNKVSGRKCGLPITLVLACEIARMIHSLQQGGINHGGLHPNAYSMGARASRAL